MTSSFSSAAAAIPAAPSSTLSPHAAPYTLRARQVGAPTGRQQDGDASRLIDENLVLPTAYFGMKPRDAAYPASTHGMHQSQPSSSSGIHVSANPSSDSSSSGYSWMASDLKQEHFPLTSGNGRSGIKSRKVTIKCPPNRTLETNNTSFGSKGKLVIRENGECNNEAVKNISFGRNLELSNPAENNGSSQGIMEFNPVLKPLCISSARPSSCVSVADDVNPDPSECSVDSPCWRGALASHVSSFDVLQTSDALSVKQESVDFDKGRGSTVQNHGASTVIENLVVSKSKQNHSQPHVEVGLLKKTGDIDTNSINDSHGKELEHANHGALKCNAEQRYFQEARNHCMKRSSLNSAAPDFIPPSVRKPNTGSGLPSSIVSHGSCSSNGRNTSGILKEIKSLSEELQDIELEEHDRSLLLLIIENLQSYLDKARKGPVKVASSTAGLKVHHSQDAFSKSVAVNHNGIYSADDRKGIIISNIAGYNHSLNNFGSNSLTGYQPASYNSGKQLSYEDDHSQVLVFKKLWIDAERANCALKYQLKQTRMEIGLESTMAHIGGAPRNPFQLCDKVTDPSSSVGHSLTCQPMLKDHPGSRKSPNLFCVGDCIHSGDNNILARSKDYAPKNVQGEHFLSDSEETGICRGLQPVPNISHMGLNSMISDGGQSHSCITGRDEILHASCEFGLSDWEHVLKDEIA